MTVLESSSLFESCSLSRGWNFQRCV